MALAPAADAFLRDRPTATLSTIRRDGSPQASVVWYLWDGDEFVISTIHTTAKWRNLRRDPRCSLCIEDPETGQMVVAYGVARLNDGEVRDRTLELVDRYYGDSAKTDAHMKRIFGTDDRVLILLSPTRFVTRRLEEGS